jgi:membrane protein DedA with SNARE-associated domain
MLITLVNILLQFAQDIGYWGIVFLMVIESSFIPFPSEIVIPPAAYLAAQGKLNIYLVAGAGILGSLIGALVNYFLAYYLGRPLIYRLAKTKWAKILLIKSAQIERAEEFFNDYRRGSTFFGRLVPVVRQLVSLPAGFAKMPLSQFILYTFLGSGIWTVVLAALGYFFGANETLWKTYYSEISWSIFIVAFIFIFYFIYRHRKK